MEFFGINLTEILNAALLVAVAFGLFSWWQSQALQKKQIKFEKSKLFIEEKRTMYLKFWKFFHKSMKGKMPDTDLMEFMIDFGTDIKTYGSADVVNTWHRFTKELSLAESQSNDDDTKAKITFREAERLLRALRKNMGHDDSELRPGSIFATHVKENEKYKIFAACEGEKYEWMDE